MEKPWLRRYLQKPRPSESAAIGYLEHEFAMSQDDIAKRLGMTKRQVQAIEYRALRKLKKAALRSRIAKELVNDSRD